MLCCAILLLFSHRVVSNFWGPHGLQHARHPCPPPSPGVCPSSCSLPWWCHPAISSSDMHIDTHVHVHTHAWPPESSKVYVLWKEELRLATPGAVLSAHGQAPRLEGQARALVGARPQGRRRSHQPRTWYLRTSSSLPPFCAVSLPYKWGEEE